MTRRGEPGGEHDPTSEIGQAKPDLSIDDIRGAAEELKRKVAGARQAKEQDIERKVSEHDELGTQILNLRELLETAQSTRDYFNTVKQAGELPKDSESQLAEIEATVAGLESQIAEAERRINLYGRQPEILDRIHEAAVSMRDSEIKEATMKNGIEDLTKGNDALAAEVDALAQELRETLEEHTQVTQDYERSGRAITELIKRATNDLEGNKHGPTIRLLNNIPTVEELQQGRSQLGMFKGKEKAALDIVLQHSDELKRYHELRDRQKVLHDKIWQELRTKKRKQLEQKNTEQMIKAWELHEQTGIQPKIYDGIHAPAVVFKDLETKVKTLGGIRLVDVQKVVGVGYSTESKTVTAQEEKIVNDTPSKKAVRDLWYDMNSGNDKLAYASYTKPEPKISRPE